MNKYYKLDGHVPIPINDVMEWAKWLESANRIVARDEIISGVIISTVFLGIDHNFCATGNPILFETMIFGGGRDEEQYRYTTWDEAVAGHNKLVERWK